MQSEYRQKKASSCATGGAAAGRSAGGIPGSAVEINVLFEEYRQKKASSCATGGAAAGRS